MTFDYRAAFNSVSRNFDSSVIPTLIEYIKIPNKSPAYNGGKWDEPETDEVIDLFVNWVNRQAMPNIEVGVRRITGRTPVIYIEIPASESYSDKKDTVLLYGHLDKQPPFEGWEDGLGPYTPVIKDGKLYGRGGADDGYALFGAIEAVKALHEQSVSHGRYVILIEACEESGSPDLPTHVAALIDEEKLANVSLVVCLDSGCGSYDTLWITTGIRGVLMTNLTVTTLREGVHSGNGGGICADSFRVVRQLLSAIEDEKTGKMVDDFQVTIPDDRLQQNISTAELLGDELWKGFPLINDCPMDQTCPVSELGLNRGWRASLTVTGIDGMPSCANGGNVLRPSTTVKLSIRLPPTLDHTTAFDKLKTLMENVPHPHARLEFSKPVTGKGWNSPIFEPWMDSVFKNVSKALFHKDPGFVFEGGSIPFLGMLNDIFPSAQLYAYFFLSAYAFF